MKQQYIASLVTLSFLLTIQPYARTHPYSYEIINHQDIWNIPEIQNKPHINLTELTSHFTDLLDQTWTNALAEKKIMFDPATDAERKPILTIPLTQDSSAPFIFFYALKRNKKPAPNHYSNTSIRQPRQTAFHLQDVGEYARSFDTIKHTLEKYHLIQSKQGTEGTYYIWNIGKIPNQDILATFLSPQEITTLQSVWQITRPDQNPFQSLSDYEQAICFFDSQESTQTYALICNRFPLFSHHFIIYSTQKDKPQYIASAFELMDMLSIQKQLHHQKYSVGFNCNNTALSQGASSVNVWHWQIAPLGISADEYTFIPLEQLSPQTIFGRLKELSSRHVAFKSISKEDIAHCCYQYLDILHNQNISYNINIGYDDLKDLYIMVITPRGNWDNWQESTNITDTNSIEMDHKPGFAEIIGAFCATTPTLYETVQKFFTTSAPEQQQNNAIILQKKWLSRACIPEKLYKDINDEYIQKRKEIKKLYQSY